MSYELNLYKCISFFTGMPKRKRRQNKSIGGYVSDTRNKHGQNSCEERSQTERSQTGSLKVQTKSNQLPDDSRSSKVPGILLLSYNIFDTGNKIVIRKDLPTNIAIFAFGSTVCGKILTVLYCIVELC